MTREEAISLLDSVLHMRSRGYYTHLQFGGKQDIAEEEHLDAMQMAIAALREQPRWIPVTERLPERKTKVLCFGESAGVFVGTDWVDWPDGKIMFRSGTTYDWPHTTHWMPLPEGPEVEA